MTDSANPYPDIGPKPDLPALEARVLQRWTDEDTFARSVNERPSEDEYVFYDGPPFANGLPHHGHLLTGYVKDVVPRYQTMRNKRVDRRFGWDCHGLPAEMEAEKQLGVSGRAAITEYGIAEFNEFCRESVLKYTDEWEAVVERQARWVDFERDYKTMDLPYMESVMWAFKQLWEKGLIYEAHRVMPYSWGAETPLSNFEIRLDDATRPRQDPAATVAFDLEAHPDDPGTLSLLAWTTTPWTLPSNLALAVGPDIEYAIMERDGSFFVLGAAALSGYERELEGATRVATIGGSDLIGRRYKPLFDYFTNEDFEAFVVIGADFIDTDEGTGVVHIAPGFGEDDQRVATENNIGMVVPVDDEGRFTADVIEWAGENVFEANPKIVRSLRENGRLFRLDSHEHNYPHCWRTDTPIIYRAMPSWYVRVTDIRDRLGELNQQINWIPENVRDGRFGRWLEGARDWSISRNRFWGSPIPIWRSDNPEYPRIDVYGSLDEIEADFGVRPTNLHRPFIDELTRPNPDDPTGESVMRRVPEVLDCWFESGSMPFAQVHYPYENKEWFEDHFPADFIVEYINQTRGWFYTLHVLAGALFDKPAFKNVICHGILLADDGAKLSKKLRNYTEPSEIFEKQGADALRWYFMSSNIVRGGDARISDHAIDDVVRQVITPIWNAYSFFTLYANVDSYTATRRTNATNVLDRYILAKTRRLVDSVTTSMDEYDLPGSADSIQTFIDALNNWYIRRSRDRFWSPATADDDTDKRDAYDTLYTVLTTLCEVSAPFLPMVTDEIYAGLTGSGSVHLAAWPDPSNLPSDDDLVDGMDRAREVVSGALRLREDHGLRVRLPLAELTIAGAETDALAPFTDVIAEEVNVKKVTLSTELGAFASFALRPNGKALGPRLGGSVQEVFRAAKQGQWVRHEDGRISVGSHVLSPDEYDLVLEAPEGTPTAALKDNEAVVALNTELTPELEAEGVARDIVRLVQEARKTEGLVVTDRIEVRLDLPPEFEEAFSAHSTYIADQVLATSITANGFDRADTSHDGLVNGKTVKLSVRRVEAT